MAVLLFSILCTGLWQETSVMKAIRVLTDGEAAAYAAEYEDRLLLLNDPEVTDVVLTPFIHQPALIYTGDLPVTRKIPPAGRSLSISKRHRCMSITATTDNKCLVFSICKKDVSDLRKCPFS